LCISFFELLIKILICLGKDGGVDLLEENHYQGESNI